MAECATHIIWQYKTSFHFYDIKHETYYILINMKLVYYYKTGKVVKCYALDMFISIKSGAAKVVLLEK